jgi:hypothetical protein
MLGLPAAALAADTIDNNVPILTSTEQTIIRLIVNSPFVGRVSVKPIGSKLN